MLVTVKWFSAITALLQLHTANLFLMPSYFIIVTEKFLKEEGVAIRAGDLQKLAMEIWQLKPTRMMREDI